MLTAAAGMAAFGAMAVTTKAYVQENLIACWDGVENNGTGGGHVSDITVWKDVVGDYGFTLKNVAVGDDRLVFSGANNCFGTLTAADTAETFYLARNGTFEIVLRAEKDTSRPGTAWKVALQSSPTAGMALADLPPSGNKRSLVSGYSSSPNVSFNWEGALNTFAVPYDDAKAQPMFINAAEATMTLATSNSFWDADDGATYLGFRQNKLNGQAFKGSICAIRLYSAKLTPEQMAANRAVDEARFIEGDLYGDDGVLVTGYPEEFGTGDSPDYGFVEKKSGDSVELTAPETVPVDEVTRVVCAGWKLYDRLGKTLLAESDASNRLKCAFEYSESVRLVWQWEFQHLVSVETTGGLSVSPVSQWAGENDSVTFTADNEVLWTGEGVDPSTRLSRTCTVSGVTAATLVSAAALPICYLSPNGAGLKDGSSWENAFSAEQLQDAIGTVATTNVLRMMTGDYPRASELTVAAGSIVKFIGGFTGKGESRDEGRSVLWRDGTTTCRLFNISKSTVHMDGLVVSNGSCTAMNDKGMGVLAVNSELVFTDCVFAKNGLNVGGYTRTDHWGGAVYQEGGSLVATRCTFRDNQLARPNAANSQLFGGAVYAKNVSSAFLGCTFTNNAVYSMNYYHNGGALFLAGSGDAVISNCTFVGNYTRRKDEPYYPRPGMGSGGAVIFSADTAKSRLRIFDSCFDGCYTRANGGGGGVLSMSGANHVTTLERVVIRNSGVQDDVDAILNHGEISLSSGTLAMTNVLIATNFGSDSVIVANGKLDAVNCTIVGAKNGCGVQAKGGATTIMNSILWGNANGGAVATGGTLDLSYCDSQDGADADAHVLSADPKLNGPAKARAFMLRRGSPCVDAGDPSMWTAGDLDLAGNPRLRNGKVDLGCYSFNAPGLMLMLK